MAPHDAHALGVWEFELWTCESTILVTDPTVLASVVEPALSRLYEIEIACSRFRKGSEVRRIAAQPGKSIRVSRVLAGLLETADRVRDYTMGAVDVRVGAAVRELGYDDHVAGTSAELKVQGRGSRPRPWAVPGLDRATGTYLARPGELLDFGSIGKAYAAREVADLIAARGDVGVLVNLGGDIAIAGPAPDGGWNIGIEDSLIDAAEPVVSLTSGALATSTTDKRRWIVDDEYRHHIVDPVTGRNPRPSWRIASVVADDCVVANAAATASIVLGERAPDFLSARGLSARLVHVDGSISYFGRWPSDLLTVVA